VLPKFGKFWYFPVEPNRRSLQSVVGCAECCGTELLNSKREVKGSGGKGCMVLLAIHALPAVGTPQEATLISIYQKNNLKGITRKVGALFLAFIQHISLFLQGNLTVHIWNVVFVLLLRFAILN